MRTFFAAAAACALIAVALTMPSGRSVAQNQQFNSVLARLLENRSSPDFKGNTCQPGVGYPYPPGIIPQGLCPEVLQVEQQIDATEEQTLQEARNLPINLGTRLIQIRTLGKLLL